MARRGGAKRINVMRRLSESGQIRAKAWRIKPNHGCGSAYPVNARAKKSVPFRAWHATAKQSIQSLTTAYNGEGKAWLRHAQIGMTWQRNGVAETCADRRSKGVAVTREDRRDKAKEKRG